MSSARRTLTALAALVVTAAVDRRRARPARSCSSGTRGPGAAASSSRDEVAIVVGVLAVLAWLVWLRFVIAVVAELRAQLAERAAPPSRPGGPVAARRPGALAGRCRRCSRSGSSRRSSSSLPVAGTGRAGRRRGPGAAAQRRRRRRLVVGPTQRRRARSQPAPATPVAGAVTVAPGDTLIGLARQHLGDADRWREIFELNRDRPQVDGGRLLSPSAIRVGWTLVLPPDASVPAAPVEAEAAPYLAPETVTVELDDTLWDLSHDRLAGAGAAHDDAAVAGYVHAVVDANPDVVEDPDLIFVGEQFTFPAVGTPPPPPPPPAPAPPAPAAAPAPPGRGRSPRRSCRRCRPSRRRPPTPTTAAPTTTTTPAPPPPVEAPLRTPSVRAGSPSPIGVGEAALLSAGVLALLAARRRHRLRGSLPRARVPEPPPEMVAAERRLRSVDAGERLLRVDIAVRAAAAIARRDRRADRGRPASASTEPSSSCSPPMPPCLRRGRATADGGRCPARRRSSCWPMPPAPSARPCVALTQLGIDADGHEVLVDLEALGVLGIAAPDALADAVVRGIAATLATSIFAEVANLVGVGIDGRRLPGSPPRPHGRRPSTMPWSWPPRWSARRHRPSRARSSCAPATPAVRRGSRRSWSPGPPWPGRSRRTWSARPPGDTAVWPSSRPVMRRGAVVAARRGRAVAARAARHRPRPGRSHRRRGRRPPRRAATRR